MGELKKTRGLLRVPPQKKEKGTLQYIRIYTREAQRRKARDNSVIPGNRGVFEKLHPCSLFDT